MFRRLAALLSAALILLSSSPARADDAYPNRPIKIIVVFSPGSSSDVSVRIYAKELTRLLGQSVVVENRPGAAGVIGMQAAQRSAPDGYTLVAVSSSTTVVAPAITKSLPYDPLKDFEPVSMLNRAPVLLTVAKENPANSLPELVADLKKKHGSYGNGAPVYQLAMELFKKRTGVQLTDVQYKGSTDAMVDMIAGRVDVMADTLASASSQMKAGKIKPIVMMSSKRTALLPDMPTMQELGYQDFVFDGWNGLLAPAGTPRAVIERLNSAIAKAGASTEVREAMSSAMLEAWTMPAADFAQLLARETAKYDKLVKETGIEKR